LRHSFPTTHFALPSTPAFILCTYIGRVQLHCLEVQ